MIFVTIGTQEPFDRLVRAMDEIALKLPKVRIVAQIINSSYSVKNIESIGFIAPTEFDSLISEAELIVSHAGMGTIISSLTKGKPLIVVPRDVRLGEHRNDHQMATAKKIDEMGYAKVVFDLQKLEDTVISYLEEVRVKRNNSSIGEWASKELTDSLRSYITHPV